MTREEQLIFCKKCSNRKMDTQQGLICNLTMEKANFSTECPDFSLGDTVKEEVSIDEPLDHVDLMSKISDRTLEKLKFEQNFQMALISGIITGLVGAVL